MSQGRCTEIRPLHKPIEDKKPSHASSISRLARASDYPGVFCSLLDRRLLGAMIRVLGFSVISTEYYFNPCCRIYWLCLGIVLEVCTVVLSRMLGRTKMSMSCRACFQNKPSSSPPLPLFFTSLHIIHPRSFLFIHQSGTSPQFWKLKLWCIEMCSLSLQPNIDCHIGYWTRFDSSVHTYYVGVKIGSGLDFSV